MTYVPTSFDVRISVAKADREVLARIAGLYLIAIGPAEYENLDQALDDVDEAVAYILTGKRPEPQDAPLPPKD